MNKPSLFILEDDKVESEKIKIFAQKCDFFVETAEDTGTAKKILEKRSFQFALIDIHLSGDMKKKEGLKFIKTISNEQPECTIIATSYDPDLSIFEHAIKNGAHHFIRKPILNADELIIAIDLSNERKNSAQLQKNITNSNKGICQYPYDLVIDDKTLNLAKRAAKNPALPVVIYGETGTGKEEIAKLIHKIRSENKPMMPFIALNCANVKEDLLESTLFGHKRGSFSGAQETTVGIVGAADNGILFLDEIQCLTQTCQQKLLRVLNDGTYTKLGDTKTLKSEFQLIVASTSDLDAFVEEGKFLLDLRTRISGIEINLLPLRERMTDIPDLIKLFFQKKHVAITENEFSNLVRKCSQYYWRGNVRQLIMALNVLIAISQETDGKIIAENLPEFKTMLAPPNHESFQKEEDSQQATQNQQADFFSEQIRFFLKNENCSFRELVSFFEKTLIMECLKQCNQNFSLACRKLKMARSSFELKRKELKF